MSALLLLLAACGAGPEEIATAIRSENPVLREDGAKIAQNFEDPAVVEALISVIDDPSEQVRLNAIESLAELEAQAAAPQLVERLKLDESAKVRRASADALGRLLAKDAVPELIVYVSSFAPDDREQLAGVWAIGFIGNQGGLEPDVKRAALDTLVRIRETTTDIYVRYNVNAALRTLK